MTEQEYESRLEEFKGTITYYFIKRLGHAPDENQMAAYLSAIKNDNRDGAWIDANLAKEPEAIALAKELANKPKLIDLNQAFDNSKRLVIKGTDQFASLMKFNNGEDITSLINESKDLGFNSWRVLFMGSKRQNGYIQLDPRDAYAAMEPFCKRLLDGGIIPLVTVNADAQDIMPDVNDRENNWRHIIDILRHPSIMFSKGNQYPKNGWNPGELSNPNIPWWSQGSGTGEQPGIPAAPYLPNGTFYEFHPRRDMPTMMNDSVASAVYLGNHGYEYGKLIISEPIGMGSKLGQSDRLQDLNIIWRLARHYSTECAGAYFHSDCGIQSITMDDTTRNCAIAWQKGMNL